MENLAGGQYIEPLTNLGTAPTKTKGVCPG